MQHPGSRQQKRPATISGKVTHPEDLTPAIEQLSDKGYDFLVALSAENDGKITPHMVAQAADFERGE